MTPSLPLAFCTKCGHHGAAAPFKVVEGNFVETKYGWCCGNPNCNYMVNLLEGDYIAVSRQFMQRLANDAWMRQDFATNAAICKLLGELTAEEHELADIKREEPDA